MNDWSLKASISYVKSSSNKINSDPGGSIVIFWLNLETSIANVTVAEL